MFGKGYVDKMEKVIKASEAVGRSKCISRIIKELKWCKPFISKIEIMDLLLKLNDEEV